MTFAVAVSMAAQNLERLVRACRHTFHQDVADGLANEVRCPIVIARFALVHRRVSKRGDMSQKDDVVKVLQRDIESFCRVTSGLIAKRLF